MKATGHGLTENEEIIRAERRSLKGKVARLATRKWNLERAKLDTTEVCEDLSDAVQAVIDHEIKYGIGFERVR